MSESRSENRAGPSRASFTHSGQQNFRTHDDPSSSSPSPATQATIGRGSAAGYGDFLSRTGTLSGTGEGWTFSGEGMEGASDDAELRVFGSQIKQNKQVCYIFQRIGIYMSTDRHVVTASSPSHSSHILAIDGLLQSTKAFLPSHIV